MDEFLFPALLFAQWAKLGVENVVEYIDDTKKKQKNKKRKKAKQKKKNKKKEQRKEKRKMFRVV